MTARREFSSSVKRAAYKRSNGVCECHLLAKAGIPGFKSEGCGIRMSDGNTWYEHIIVDAAGGEPTLENCAVLTKACGRLKSRTYDAPKAADTRRLSDRARNIKPRKGRPMPGTRASGIRKRMNGNVERWQ